MEAPAHPRIDIINVFSSLFAYFLDLSPRGPRTLICTAGGAPGKPTDDRSTRGFGWISPELILDEGTTRRYSRNLGTTF